MIRAIYVVVEGQTEGEFVKSLMRPYFADRHNFYDVQPILMTTSPGHRGGDVSFARYQKNIALKLKERNDALITSLIDFYRLSSDFPKHVEASKFSQVEDRVAFLENACSEVIISKQFVPYIQLYEFEALLFTSIQGFKYLGTLSKSQREAIRSVIDQFHNPELINEGQQTAPSKRLATIIPGYQKVLYGNMIALENGFATILNKCPRFRAWIELLGSKIQRDG